MPAEKRFPWKKPPRKVPPGDIPSGKLTLPQEIAPWKNATTKIDPTPPPLPHRHLYPEQMLFY